MAILGDTARRRRTVVIQKDGGIIPIDHLVDTRLEKVVKQPGYNDLYIWPPNGGSGDANT